MNEEWTWRPLGELFKIGAGKTMSVAARNGADKTPFLRTSNVLWDEIDLSSVDEMSIPEHELPAKLLWPGDLLVCEGGEIGRAAIWGGEVEPMSFQNHVHRLRPIVEEVDPRFYVYFLQSGFTQLGIYEGTGNKTTIPNLSRSRLAGLDVPQPPLAEQQAISCVLSDVRDAIKVQAQEPCHGPSPQTRRDAYPVHARAAGRGAEGYGDWAGTGKLGSRQLISDHFAVVAGETPIWYVGPVHVRRIWYASRASYPEHRTAALSTADDLRITVRIHQAMTATRYQLEDGDLVLHPGTTPVSYWIGLGVTAPYTVAILGIERNMQSGIVHLIRARDETQSIT